MKLKKIKWALIVLLAFLGADALVAAGYLAYCDATRLKISPKITHHLVVLFSGFGDSGTIDEETERRLNKAANLSQHAPTANILCIGGARPESGRYGTLLMRNYLVSLGFDPTRILTEMHSNSSQSNILAATQILHQMGIAEATLISSPIHLPRLKYLADRVSPEIEFHLIPYGFKTSRPPISTATIYRQIHHELAAFMLDWLLPESCFSRLINFFRA